jgi:hypothetical protein
MSRHASGSGTGGLWARFVMSYSGSHVPTGNSEGAQAAAARFGRLKRWAVSFVVLAATGLAVLDVCLLVVSGRP